MSKSHPHLISPIEAAMTLGLPTVNLMKMARRGEVPHVELPGGVLCFDRHELVRFVDERRRPVTEGDQ